MNSDTKEETAAAPEMSTVGLSSKEFNLKGGKDEFNLKIFEGKNSIIFHGRIKNDLSETLYVEETDFEEFHNLNRIFRQYISLEQIFQTIYFCKRII